MVLKGLIRFLYNYICEQYVNKKTKCVNGQVFVGILFIYEGYFKRTLKKDSFYKKKRQL